MTWIAGGAFQPMLHLVPDDASNNIFLDGRRYWWSLCDHVCVVIPPELTIDQICWPWCQTCFPDTTTIEQALRTTQHSNG